MLKAYKYRIYPNKAQAKLINKHIGSCRFVYNLALECKQMTWAGNRVNLSCFDLVKQLPDLKAQCIWLKEINSQSLQQSIVNLDTAFTKFFKGQADFPKFKKKTAKQSFNIPQNLSIKAGKLVIPKFQTGINIVLHREIKGEIKQATISRTPTGKYFASILVDNNQLPPVKKAIKDKTAIGIDLGVKNFLVTSDGKQFESNKFLKKSLLRLKFIQRKYSKHKGRRTKYRLQRLHEIVANQRKDFLNKTSTELINSHDSICIEDLNIAGMIKNHKLAQSITDASWSEFIRQLQYKAEWAGKNIIRIGRFEPSSKTCSVCGTINKELQLKDRNWACNGCNSILDRDINAAVNIKNFGLRNYLSGTDRKTRNELPTLVGVLTSE